MQKRRVLPDVTTCNSVLRIDSPAVEVLKAIAAFCRTTNVACVYTCSDSYIYTDA